MTRTIALTLILTLGIGLIQGKNAQDAFAYEAEKPAAGEEAGPFSDVNAHSRFKVPLQFLKDNRLVAGYSDGSFHPESRVSRAEALAMILKVAGSLQDQESAEAAVQTIVPETPMQISLPKSTTITMQNLATGEKTTLTNIQHIQIEAESGVAHIKLRKKSLTKPFEDVSEKDWFYDIVAEAKREGIVSGSGKGTHFLPNRDVNLAETLRMLFQGTKIKTDLSEFPLPDGIPPDVWYSQDVRYALERSILTQLEDGHVFPPASPLTRGEISLLLYRFLKTKSTLTFGYASWYGDGLAKTKLSHNTDYAERFLTAAHKTLPLGTLVRVTNMENGNQITVVVNDRGPFVRGRIIDLSKTAFSALESPTMGLVSVQVEPLP